MPAVLSVWGVWPRRIGGCEVLIEEMNRQLAAAGWRHIAVFTDPPTAEVAMFLAADNFEWTVRDVMKRGFLWQLDDLLRRYRPDVVHFHFVPQLTLWYHLAALRGVRSIFFTDHTSVPEGFQIEPAAWWKRGLARALKAPLKAQFAVSEFVGEAMAQRGMLDRAKLRVVHNGCRLVELDQAPRRRRRFRERFRIPESALVVGQIGWLIEPKGFADLLDAAVRVREDVPESHFIVAGDGPLMAELQQQSAALGLRNHVTFTGLLDDPLEDGFYDACDLVCQPSRWQEAFGWVLAEAMSCARPIVATKVGGIPEVVQANGNGLLCPPRRPDRLAEAITHLLQSPDVRQEMGARSRRIAEESFDVTVTVRKTLDEYGVPPVAPPERLARLAAAAGPRS